MKIDELVASTRPNMQRQGELVQRRSAEQRERRDRQEQGERGADRARQRLVDAPVDDLPQRPAGRVAEIFPDPVIDDDLVVDRKAHDGEDRRDGSRD